MGTSSKGTTGVNLVIILGFLSGSTPPLSLKHQYVLCGELFVVGSLLTFGIPDACGGHD